MTRTARAIKTLRAKLGLSQAAFAERLGTTITTVSRYENDRIEPSEEALRKLADASAAVGLVDLREFFDNQRKIGILARVEKLPSPGTQRRVSVNDLSSWFDHLDVVAQALIKTRTKVNEPWGMPEEGSTDAEWPEFLLRIKESQFKASDDLRAYANLIKLVQAEIYPYLPPERQAYWQSVWKKQEKVDDSKTETR